MPGKRAQRAGEEPAQLFSRTTHTSKVVGTAAFLFSPPGWSWGDSTDLLEAIETETRPRRPPTGVGVRFGRQAGGFCALELSLGQRVPEFAPSELRFVTQLFLDPVERQRGRRSLTADTHARTHTHTPEEDRLAVGGQSALLTSSAGCTWPGALSGRGLRF